jgi:uncharacterized protein YcbX
MTGRVAAIWRHPIKSHGRETLNNVTLTAGQTMPGDRVWAVAHEASKADGSAWAPSAAWSIGTRTGSLQAIAASYDEAGGQVTLSHPDLSPVTLAPDTEGQRLIDWVRPLMDPSRAQPTRVLRLPGRGMTDTDYPSVSLINLASHAEVETRIGHAISPLRWRGNFLIEGLDPWVEFGWIGRRLRLGGAEIEIRERTRRCAATTIDPATGRRDADTPAVLEATWGHRDCGVYAIVTASGEVRAGDRLELLA